MQMAKFSLIWFSYNQLVSFQRQFLRLILRLIFLSAHFSCRFVFLLVISTFLFVALFYYIAHLILKILSFGVLEYCKAPRQINGRWRYINVYLLIDLFID